MPSLSVVRHLTSLGGCNDVIYLYNSSDWKHVIIIIIIFIIIRPLWELLIAPLIVWQNQVFYSLPTQLVRLQQPSWHDTYQGPWQIQPYHLIFEMLTRSWKSQKEPQVAYLIPQYVLVIRLSGVDRPHWPSPSMQLFIHCYLYNWPARGVCRSVTGLSKDIWEGLYNPEMSSMAETDEDSVRSAWQLCLTTCQRQLSHDLHISYMCRPGPISPSPSTNRA